MGRIRFLAFSAGAILAAVLALIFLRDQLWVVAGVVVLVVLVVLVVWGEEFLYGRVRGDGAPNPDGWEEPSVRRLTAEEVRTRAAAERAERDLFGRGSHPLGHPGSGGRMDED